MDIVAMEQEKSGIYSRGKTTRDKLLDILIKKLYLYLCQMKRNQALVAIDLRGII